MQKGDSYPNADQLREQDRRFAGGRMEEEAQLREAYGTPEERDHERLRVTQEWDKIDHDKAKGLNDSDIWQGHLGRMKKMSASMKCPKKCERRAKHFELAGLTSGARMFQERAQALSGDAKKPVDPQKDVLIDNLQKFTEFAIEISKYRSRRVGEIWTREGGERVTKRPDGIIIPYTAPKGGRGRKPGDSNDNKQNKKSAAKKLSANGLGDLGLLKDGDKLKSPHFGKSEADLRNQVKELLRRISENPQCLISSDMSNDEKAIKEFRRYNRGVCESESSAKKFGERGLKNEGGDTNSSSERKFWLAAALLFGDLAEMFSKLREKALSKEGSK